jgi:hypothetical protein
VQSGSNFQLVITSHNRLIAKLQVPVGWSPTRKLLFDHLRRVPHPSLFSNKSGRPRTSTLHFPPCPQITTKDMRHHHRIFAILDRKTPPSGTPKSQSHFVEHRLYPKGAYCCMGRFRPTPEVSPSPWVYPSPPRPLHLQDHQEYTALPRGKMHQPYGLRRGFQGNQFLQIQTLA